MRSVGNKFLVVLFAAALVVVGTAPGWAQSGTASLSGRVLDPQGSVVPGATVVVTRLATAVTRTAVSNESGVYQFTGLAPGMYALTASLSGFSTAKIENLEVRTDTANKQDVELALGEMTEEVTVTAEAPLLNTADASIGNTLEQRAIESLPAEGRSVVELLSLQPGAVFVPFADDVSEDDDARYGAVSGARTDQQNVTLDGVDVNDPELATAYTSAVRVTQEALQEFRVSTSNYGAEYGRSSGPQVSMVTKGGSNEWHGSAYWFGRRTGTSTNEYFLELSQTEQGLPSEAPILDKDIFGGALGGPLVKDRVFFYLNYEKLKANQERPVVRAVPSASMRDGVLMYRCAVAALCPGGTVRGFSNSHTVEAGWHGLTPAEIAAIDPLGIGPSQGVSAYFNQFPLPNEPGLDGHNIMDYRFPANIENDYNTYIARLDAKLTNSHNVFLRFNAQDDEVADPPQYPGEPATQLQTFKNWGLAVGSDWALTNKLMNTFRYGYTRIDEAAEGTLSGDFVDFRFISDINPNTATETRKPTVHNFVEQLSWLKGDHTIKGGINLRFTRIPSTRNGSSYNYVTINPSWVAGVGRWYQPGRTSCTSAGCSAVPAVSTGFASGYADAWLNILGVLSESGRNVNYLRDGSVLPSGQSVERNYAMNEYEFFLSDSWQIRPNLTLTGGVRWSLYSPPWETNGLQVAPTINMGEWFDQRRQMGEDGIPSNQSPITQFDLSGPANNGDHYYEFDKNNIAPHFAFAWTPRAEGGLLGALTGNEELVLRGGYYKVFDRIGLGLARQFDRNYAYGMATSLNSPYGLPYEQDPAVRFVDLSTMPPTLPAAPAGEFPTTPPLEAGIITGSVDASMETPYAHVVSFAVARQLGKDFSIEAAYVGRFGRKQLTRRDLAMPLNLTDPNSGMDYFTAAQQLIGAARAAGLNENSDPAEFAALGAIPYWENLFPDAAMDGLTATQMMGYYYTAMTPDYITALWLADQFCDPACSIYGPYAYFSQQYDSLGAISTVGKSDYNALQLTLRKRMSHGIQFDLNYTLSKSEDMGSSAERNSAFGSNFDTGGYSGFLVNPWDPDTAYGRSDYDLTHQVNLNFIWDLPFGEGRRVGGGSSGALNQIVGDWSLSGLVRWTAGFPFNVYNCRSCWATNWNLQGNAMLAEAGVLPPLGLTLDAVDGRPSPYTDPEGALEYFRFALPGEVGERNILNGDGFFTIDLSLSKSFKITGDHRLRLRADVFNLTDRVSYDVAALTMFPDRTGFGRYDGSMPVCDGMAGRCMQFALRYEF